MDTSDLVPVTPPATNAPFVAVYADKPTGRIVIALDADAAADLSQYLGDIGPGHELGMDPGAYGVDDTTGSRISAMVCRIAADIDRAHGWL